MTTLGAYDSRSWTLHYLDACAALARAEERLLVDDAHLDAILRQGEREYEACGPCTRLQGM